MYKLRIYSVLFLLASAMTANAEGTRELAPSSTDVAALVANYIAFGSTNFAGYNAAPESRLYFKIADPENEQVFIGLSQMMSILITSDGDLQNIDYYFRIKDPSGTVVFGPQLVNASNANTNTWALASTGPNTIYPGGYTPFVFNPDGLSAGDYYIEFSRNANSASATTSAGYVSIKYFDITVATEDPTPSDIKGRVFSQNWGLRTPSIGQTGATAFDRSFNGALFAYSHDGFVSKIDFAGSDFRGLRFEIVFNSFGTSNTGDFAVDRKSVQDTNSVIPEYLVFINDPDINCYPSGVVGAHTIEPIVDPCFPDSVCFMVTATQAGQVEILIDLDGPDGLFTAGTRDVIIVDSIGEQNGTPPFVKCFGWNTVDGLGDAVDLSDPIQVASRYAQGVTHFPTFDVEYNTTGFTISHVRPLSGTPPELFYDDSQITSAPGTGIPQVELNGCTPPCHNWDSFVSFFQPGYGNLNTINTWWISNPDTIELLADLSIDDNVEIYAAPDSNFGFFQDVLPLTPLDNDTGALHIPSMKLLDTAGLMSGTVSLDTITGVITFTPNPTFIGEEQFRYQICDSAIVCPGGNVIQQCDTGVLFVQISGPAFECTDRLYISQSTNPTTATFLTNLTTDTNPFGLDTLGDNSHNKQYNGIGFSPVDFFVYGIRRQTNRLILVDSLGFAFDLGRVIGLPAGNYFAGDFSIADSLLYVRRSSGPLYGINVNDVAVQTTIPLSNDGVVLPDIAYNPVNDLFYSVDQTSQDLISIDPITGQVILIGNTGLTTVGAMYASADGRIYGNNNDGDGFYQFDLNTGVAVKISESPGASVNDGAGCNLAGIQWETDLSIEKTDFDSVYVPGSTTTYEIQVVNLGGSGVVGAIIRDHLPTGITNAVWSCVRNTLESCTSSGTGSLVDTVNLGVGDTVTYEITIDIPEDYDQPLINKAQLQFPDNVNDTVIVNNTSCDTNEILVHPIAVDDSITTESNIPVTIDVLENDTMGSRAIDIGSLDTLPGTGPMNGIVAIDTMTGEVTYLPDEHFSGVDSFDYVICDIGVPAACDTATVVVTIVADQPVAVDDATTTPSNTSVMTDPLSNDMPGTNPLDPTSVDSIPGSGPVNGMIDIDPNTGVITYTPDPNFSGVDSFDYVMCDSTQPNPLCDTATVVITVVGGPPVAVDDTSTTPSNVSVMIHPLSNDVPGTSPIDPTSVDSIPGSGPMNGTIDIDPNTGMITYTPDPNFGGVDSFDYVMCDSTQPEPLCDTATIVVTVVADPPAAVDDVNSTAINRSVTTNPLSNDVAGSNPLDPTSVDSIPGSGPMNGMIDIDPNTGEISYTPHLNFVGVDSFSYVVCDSTHPDPLCDTAVITVVVTAHRI